jgi:hypothetical protein
MSSDWTFGSSLFCKIAEIIESTVSDSNDRKEIYKEILTAFEDHGCEEFSSAFGIDEALDGVLEESYDIKDEDNFVDEDDDMNVWGGDRGEDF